MKTTHSLKGFGGPMGAIQPVWAKHKGRSKPEATFFLEVAEMIDLLLATICGLLLKCGDMGKTSSRGWRQGRVDSCIEMKECQAM